MTTHAFSEFSDALIGLPVSAIWQGDGAALFVEFGRLFEGRIRTDGSVGNPHGEVTLMLDQDWRCERGSAVLCGSRDSQAVALQILSRLAGTAVARAQLCGSVGEIEILFADGSCLTSFQTARGGPDWGLICRNLGCEVGVLDGKLNVVANPRLRASLLDTLSALEPIDDEFPVISASPA